MVPGLSTHVFLRQRLTPGLLEGLRLAGAKHIELYAARHHFDYTDRGAVREIAGYFRSNEGSVSLHQPLTSEAYWTRHSSPSLNLIDAEKMRRIDAMDEVKRALEVAEQIPLGAAVLHLGGKDEAWSARALEHSLTAIEHLKAFAHPLGVRLLLETLENEVTTPEHLLEILRTGHFDTVGVCVDLGHVHLNAQKVGGLSLEETVRLLGPRIGEVHVHDNDGHRDQHLWPVGLDSAAPTADRAAEADPVPTTASIDWRAATGLLRGLPVQTPAILEIAHELEETPESVLAKTAAFSSFQARLEEQLQAAR